MNNETYFSFLNKIKKDKSVSYPFILIHGFNEFLGENIIKQLRDNFLEEKSEFNYRRYYFDNENSCTIDDVLNDASSSNFFLQSRKIIILTIRETKKLTFKKDELATLNEYLKQPNKNTILVIYVSLNVLRDDFKQVKKQKIDKLTKTLEQKNLTIIDLDRMYEKDINNYIKSELKNMGISITASALEKLADLKGDDLPSILGQMPLFEIITKTDNVIDTDDIDQIVTGVSTHSIWDLTEAIEKENIEKYLNVLTYLFINGIKAPFIIGTLITHYNKIFTAKYLLKNNYSNYDIGKILAQPSFILNRFLSSVKYFSDEKLQKILDLIYKIDMEAKTGGEEAVKLSLRNFIFQVKIV